MMKIAKVIYQEHSRFKSAQEQDENGDLQIIRTKRSPDDPSGFRLALPQPLPMGFDRQNPKHRAVGAAMVYTDTSGGSIDDFFDTDRRVRQFLRKHDLETGQPNFDVALELLSAEHNRDLRLEDFYKVLFAVNSCLGEKGYRRITRKMIAARTAGVKDATKPAWMGRPLTERQVEYSLGKLQAKRFIYRAVVARKFTFIANPIRLELDDLIAIAKRWKQKRKADTRAVRISPFISKDCAHQCAQECAHKEKLLKRRRNMVEDGPSSTLGFPPRGSWEIHH
jgi:hypothetical protein